jgi:alpha-N-arabinofuranosidase
MLQLSKWYMCAMLAIVNTGMAAAQPVEATIHADRQTGAPISKLIFGGFMEPATTRVWAEMLGDRKFLNTIDSKPQPLPTGGGFGRRGPQARWMPVGADEFVTMDSSKAYVGDWSPLVRLQTGTPHGIREAGLQLHAGRNYTGRVVLAGSPGTTVDVSLIWGPNPADRQTVSVRIKTAEYTKYPVAFTSRANTSQGAFEIAATGNGSFHIGATSLMPADNVSGFRADMIRMLKEQGIEIARWPGGNFVSAYDWRDGIGDADKRPPRRELARHSLESNDMGINDFMTFCRLVGAEPYIAIDSGRGDDHSAAEEVEYVNGPPTSRLGKMRAANGHPAPYGVKIWGIGNEMYGPWQWGYMANNYYAEKHNLIVRAMRKVDPAIKVIASGATPEEMSWTYIENRQFSSFPGRETVSDKVPYAFGSKYDWTGGLLANSADYIDYLGEHFYGYPDWYVDEATQQFVPSGEPLADKVRRMSNRVEFKFEAWDEYVKRMPYLKEKDIKFAFDEWSPRGRQVPAGNASTVPDNPMLNSLTEALVYHEFFRHSDKVGLAVATGGMGMMAMDANGDAIGLRTDGLVMKLLHDHFATALPVEVSGNSPQHDVKGTVAVDKGARPSGSPTYPLDVFAAISADHRKLEISVVNPTEKAQACDLNLAGIQVVGTVKVWRITAPSGPVTVPTRAGGFFSGPPATLEEATFEQTPPTVTLPPTSVNVYEFQIRQ